MPRIDLFTSPDCPGCPAARESVGQFARRHPEVEVHEWDLSRDPGPAVGRGIFATPSVLVNGVHVLLGVPKESDLLQRLGALQGLPGDRHVLVVNAYDDFLTRPVFEVLSRAGYVPTPVDSVVVAVHALRTRPFEGVVVGLNPKVDAEGHIERSGIGVWAEILLQLGDTPWASRPILVTAASAGLARSELAEHGVTNPVLVVTTTDLADPAFPRAVERHFFLPFREEGRRSL